MQMHSEIKQTVYPLLKDILSESDAKSVITTTKATHVKIKVLITSHRTQLTTNSTNNHSTNSEKKSNLPNE